MYLDSLPSFLFEDTNLTAIYAILVSIRPKDALAVTMEHYRNRIAHDRLRTMEDDDHVHQRATCMTTPPTATYPRQLSAVILPQHIFTPSSFVASFHLRESIQL